MLILNTQYFNYYLHYISNYTFPMVNIITKLGIIYVHIPSIDIRYFIG